MIGLIGRYRIVRALGEGGMGRTYLAEVAGPGGFSRRVVLKVVRDELDPALAQALLDEARLVASLAHRNVCPVLDFQEIDGHRFVVLDHVDGLDLRELMSRRPHLPWPLAAFIASEIAAALDYAHRRCDGDGRPLGLVHRDVSPANILLSWEGEVKLADFGVARFDRPDAGPHSIAGKVGYMAPEQSGGVDIDGRADVFALGVTLYESLAGINPLAGGARRLPPLRVGDVPAALAEIVARATAPLPEERPTAARLRELLLELPTLPRDPAPQLAAYMAEARVANPGARTALLRAAAGTRRALTYVVTSVAPRRGRVRLLAALAALLIVGVGIGVALVGIRARASRALRRVSTAPANVTATAPHSAPPPTSVVDATPVERVSPVPQPPTPGPAPSPSRPKRHVAPSAAPHLVGELSVNATPWATVYLDGKELGHTPQLGLRVPAGRHVVRLVTKSGDSRTRSVDVSPGHETRVAVNFAEP